MKKKQILITVIILFVAAGVLLAAKWKLPMTEHTLNPLMVTVLKVGKADATVIQTEKETMVIDTGEEEDGKEIAEFLAAQNIRQVDILIITHFDQDHVGGADTLLESVKVKRVLLPDYEGSGTEYRDFICALKQADIQAERLTQPVSFPLGEASILVEPPLSYEDASLFKEIDNDLSLITTISHGKNRFLFMGDAEKSRIREWLSGENAKTCNFLKFPHHGVYNTALEDLMKVTRPQYTVICSSEKNPAQTLTMELLKQYHTQTFQTKDGDTTVISDGTRLEIQQHLN